MSAYVRTDYERLRENGGGKLRAPLNLHEKEYIMGDPLQITLFVQSKCTEREKYLFLRK